MALLVEGLGQFEGQKKKLSSVTVLVSMGIFLHSCLHILVPKHVYSEQHIGQFEAHRKIVNNKVGILFLLVFSVCIETP
jgi:hypothetical protein